MLRTIADARPSRTASPRWTPPWPPRTEWAATAPRERGEILRRAFELCRPRREDFALLMTLEMGKPLAEARGEVTYGAEFLRWFTEEAVRDLRPLRVATRRAPAAWSSRSTRWARAS